jgi:TATA-binding protein-associated factor Taf7
MNTMNETINKRAGNKWTINEILQLQREYELLEWTIQQIAEKHQRSVDAILFKLEDERFIDGWINARGFNLIGSQTQQDTVEQDTVEQDTVEQDTVEHDTAEQDTVEHDIDNNNINITYTQEDEDVEDEDVEDVEDEDVSDEEQRYNLNDKLANLEYKIDKLTKMVKKIYKNTFKNNSITASSTTSSIEDNLYA